MKIYIPALILLLQLLPATIAGAAETSDKDSASTTDITVYRSPDCNCCHRWIEHLRDNGFKVKDRQTERLMLIKQKLKIPEQLASCHTATIDGYVIEGHVPAGDIRRLLADRPDARGLSVPGMPEGSPGMETGRYENYSVIRFRDENQMSLYRHYPAE